MDHWESTHNSHQLLAQRLDHEMYDEDGNDDRRGLGSRTVACGFRYGKMITRLEISRER